MLLQMDGAINLLSRFPKGLRDFSFSEQLRGGTKQTFATQPPRTTSIPTTTTVVGKGGMFRLNRAKEMAPFF